MGGLYPPAPGARRSDLGGQLLAILNGRRPAEKCCEFGNLLLVPPNAHADLRLRLPQADRQHPSGTPVDHQPRPLETRLALCRRTYALLPQSDGLVQLACRDFSTDHPRVHDLTSRRYPAPRPRPVSARDPTAPISSIGQSHPSVRRSGHHSPWRCGSRAIWRANPSRGSSAEGGSSGAREHRPGQPGGDPAIASHKTATFQCGAGHRSQVRREFAGAQIGLLAELVAIPMIRLHRRRPVLHPGQVVAQVAR